MPKPTRKTMSVTLDEGIFNDVQAKADARMVAPSLLVQKALEAFLPTLAADPLAPSAPETPTGGDGGPDARA